MKNDDLGSKKTNNKQNTNEDFTDKNPEQEYNPAPFPLTAEVEIDADGNEKTVQRARNVDGSLAAIPNQDAITWNDNESVSRGVATEKEVSKTIENKDLNSDITAHRYPNSHPDNHKDRGNIKLDQ